MKRTHYRKISKIISLANKGVCYSDITKITGAARGVIQKYVKLTKPSNDKNDYASLINYLNQIEVFE